jgi:predicted transcriptional regulator
MNDKSHVSWELRGQQTDDCHMTDIERQEFAAAVAEGRADIRRGDFVSLAEARALVASWGTKDEIPMPKAKNDV